MGIGLLIIDGFSHIESKDQRVDCIFINKEIFEQIANDKDLENCLDRNYRQDPDNLVAFLYGAKIFLNLDQGDEIIFVGDKGTTFKISSRLKIEQKKFIINNKFRFINVCV